MDLVFADKKIFYLSFAQIVSFKEKLQILIFSENWKARTFGIWYVASARGLLPRLFNLWPWGPNGAIPEVICFT